MTTFRDYHDDGLDYDDVRAGRFADPGGESALHAGNRVHECPTCMQPNRLTVEDVRAGYQCDGCAQEEERGALY